MELLEFLKVAQGFGTPALLAMVWLLWRIERALGAIERRMAVMKEANDVLTDTLLRLVPGFREANNVARAALAERRVKA